MIPRLSRRQKAALAAVLAVLLWAPTGLSVNSSPLVTGHSTFYNGKGFDPCLASVVGVLKTDVMWFNDMVLVSRYGGKGTFVYITENGSDDPTRKEFLYSDGVSYEFTDPNGATWIVEELWWTNGYSGHTSKVGTSSQSGNDLPEATLVHEPDKTYVWVVELSSQPIYDLYAPKDPQDPNYHTVYNFVSLVDTCKFHRFAATNYYGNRWAGNPGSGYLDYNMTHTQNDTYWDTGHRASDGDHTHEAFLAQIYLGKKPLVVRNANANQLHPSWEDKWSGVGIG